MTRQAFKTLFFLGLLESEQHKESDHEAKQAHGFGQGKPKDGIGEQLLFKGGVSGITNYQTTKHRTNSNTYKTQYFNI